MKHTCEAPSWKPVPSADDPQTFHYVCSACGEVNPLMIGTTRNELGKPSVFGASWGHSSGPKSDDW